MKLTAISPECNQQCTVKPQTDDGMYYLSESQMYEVMSALDWSPQISFYGYVDGQEYWFDWWWDTKDEMIIATIARI